MRGKAGLAFIFLILFPVIVLVPDLIIYGTMSYKANAIVEHTTKEAEMLGGITTDVESRFEEVLSQYGLTDKGFTLYYDRQGQVEHRGRFVVQLRGQYTFRSFNLLGTGIGHFTVPITATDSGISEVWIR